MSRRSLANAPSRPERRSSGILGDLGTSLLAQGLVVLGNLASLKCAAVTMSVGDVSQFVLVRRIVVFLVPLLLLGLGVGLPRSLGAHLSGDNRRDYGAGLMLSGWMLGAVMALLAAACLLLFPETMASLLLGSAHNARLVPPLALMIVGHQMFMLVYAVRRGRLQIRSANLFQVVQIAVVPPVVVLWKGGDGVQAVLETLGGATILVSGLATMILLLRPATVSAIGHLRGALRELLQFGVPRVPGDLAAAGLYAVGPILAAHQLGVESAGLLAAGMSLITVLSMAFGPLGLVLLPRLSRAISDGQQDAIRERLPLVVGVTLLSASTIALGGAFLGNTLLRWILNEAFFFEPTHLALLMVAAGANVVFVVLRSAIDAASVRPFNALHTSISLILLGATWAIAMRFEGSGGSLGPLCLSTAVAFLTLAILTVRRIGHLYDMRAGMVLHACVEWAQGRGGQGISKRGITDPHEAEPGRLGHDRCTSSSEETDSRQDEVERVT